MSESRELDLKLLDRSLERFASDRQAFARDFKIALAIIALFQFGVFFRYVDLSDRGKTLSDEVRDVGKAQATLKAVENGLAGMSDVLKAGEAKVLEDLGRGPGELRGKIVALSADLQTLRERLRKTANPSGGNPVAQVAQAGVAGNGDLMPLVRDLTEEQKQIIREGYNTEKVDKIVKTLIKGSIVPEVFAELNRRKAEWIDTPLGKEAERVIAAIKDKPALVPTIYRDHNGKPLPDWDARKVLEAVRQATTDISSLQIHPPENDNWWKTIPDKIHGFEIVSKDAQNAFSRVEKTLGESRASLGDIAKVLDGLADEVGARKHMLDGEMTDLNKKYDDVKMSLASLAKPLSAVSLEARDLVRYDPVILSVAFVFFLLRYITLRSRARELSSLCSEMGYSDRTVDFYFSDAISRPLPSFRGIRIASIARALVAIGIAIPWLLVAVSAWQILTSSSLAPDAPRLLSVLAVTLLAVVTLTTFRSMPAALSTKLAR